MISALSLILAGGLSGGFLGGFCVNVMEAPDSRTIKLTLRVNDQDTLAKVIVPQWHPPLQISVYWHPPLVLPPPGYHIGPIEFCGFDSQSVTVNKGDSVYIKSEGCRKDKPYKASSLIVCQ